MSKGRKPPEREAPRQRAVDAELAPDSTLEEQLLGNQAVQSQLASLGAATGGVSEAVADLAHRTTLALAIAPRDRAWTERLTQHVARSHLPPERRDAILDRLRADQAAADDVASAVREWLGHDGPELRAAVVEALAAGARDARHAEANDGLGVAEAAEQLLAEHAAQSLPGVAPEAVRGLLGSLTLLVELVWDEEEEEGAPGDYAAEESGA